jgi:hypothetical protein
MDRIRNGLEAENWVKQVAEEYHLLFHDSYNLEDLVLLVERKLQKKFIDARIYCERKSSSIDYAEFFKQILETKKIPDLTKEMERDIKNFLLDRVLSIDLIVKLKDNQGCEKKIAIDVTCEVNNQDSKLDVIQGRKKRTNLTSRYNANKNIPEVRRSLGIDKHIVLVVNNKNFPSKNSLIEGLFAVANNPHEFQVLNLYKETPKIKSTKQLENASRKAVFSTDEIEQINILEKLTSKEIIKLFREVNEYFSNKPSIPPTEKEITILKQEAEELESRINDFWKQYESYKEDIDTIKRKPLYPFVKNLDESIDNSQKILSEISLLLSKKQALEEKISTALKEQEIYKRWLESGTTRRFLITAKVLRLPRFQSIIQKGLQEEDDRQKQIQKEDGSKRRIL